jgi:glutamate/tyrosine decarboxylase-like PLP-dependent enzyme
MNKQRTSPIEMKGNDFRAIGYQLVDRIADLLDSLPTRPLTTDEPPTAIREALNSSRSLPNSGTDPAKLIEHATELMFNHSLFNSHPRFWGYITAGAAPIGILGDLLASAVNQNTGAWFLSPMASEIEAQTIRWIAELLG